MLKQLTYLLLIFIFIANCSSKSNNLDNVSKSYTPEELYIDAMSDFNNEKYEIAVEKFDQIEKLFPLSNEAIQSQIMSAFVNYMQLSYDDALLKFNRIINKYPSLKNLDYVFYMKAMCYYEQISHEGLDGENNILALSSFDQVIKRFPESEYAKDSYQKIILVKSNIAAKHMNIGRFYHKKNKYMAALNRYKIVVDDYSVTKFTPEALYRMVEIYYEIGMIEEARNAASVIAYNYPDSVWYKYSYELLEKKEDESFLGKIKNIF